MKTQFYGNYAAQMNFNTPPYDLHIFKPWYESKNWESEYSYIVWMAKMHEFHHNMAFTPPVVPQVFMSPEDAVLKYDDGYEEGFANTAEYFNSNTIVYAVFTVYLLGWSVHSLKKMPHNCPKAWIRPKSYKLNPEGWLLIYLERILEYLELILLNGTNAALLLPYAATTENDIEMILNGLAILFIADIDEGQIDWCCNKREQMSIKTWHFKVLSGMPIDPVRDVEIDSVELEYSSASWFFG